MSGRCLKAPKHLTLRCRTTQAIAATSSSAICAASDATSPPLPRGRQVSAQKLTRAKKTAGAFSASPQGPARRCSYAIAGRRASSPSSHSARPANEAIDCAGGTLDIAGKRGPPAPQKTRSPRRSPPATSAGACSVPLTLRRRPAARPPRLEKFGPLPPVIAGARGLPAARPSPPPRACMGLVVWVVEGRGGARWRDGPPRRSRRGARRRAAAPRRSRGPFKTRIRPAAGGLSPQRLAPDPAPAPERRGKTPSALSEAQKVTRVDPGPGRGLPASRRRSASAERRPNGGGRTWRGPVPTPLTPDRRNSSAPGPVSGHPPKRVGARRAAAHVCSADGRLCRRRTVRRPRSSRARRRGIPRSFGGVCSHTCIAASVGVPGRAGSVHAADRDSR